MPDQSLIMGYELGVGGTAVGIRSVSGVVIAADKRLAYGYTILSKAAKKVYVITPTVGIGFAGVIGDMQALVRRLDSAVRLREIESGSRLTVRAIAKLTSVMLYEARMTPYITQSIVGGCDQTGCHLFSMDALGSLLEEDFVSVGSGAAVSIGLLEENYRKDLSLEQMAELSKKSLGAAASRDAVSGDGLDMLRIDSTGVKEETIAFRSV